MHNDAQSIVVRHKEYLGEIRSAQVFAVQQSFPLNPGLSTTFPWLNGIASKFQEYKIRGLVFHYIPTSGSAVSSTNAALGSVMLQTSYRSTDSLPSSKVEMLNEYCSNEVVPSDAMAHPIECDPKENPFNVQYVRSGAVPGADTQLMYDLGITHVAVSGCQTTGNVLGDLWVTYDIELKKPVVASNAVNIIESGSQFYTNGTLSSPEAIFGPSTVLMGGTLAATTNQNLVTFPKGTVGTFAIALILSGSSLSASWTTNTLTGCVAAPIWSGSAETLFISIGSTSFLYCLTNVTITDPAVSATIRFNSSGTGTLTATRFEITQVA
jgi:hypothetical protein